MARRIALAAVYTLFVVALLSTWPRWADSPPSIDNLTVITAVPMARWLLILTPFYWGWAALRLEPTWARSAGLAGSAVLFILCFLFIMSQDARGPLCIWAGHCGPGWFN